LVEARARDVLPGGRRSPEPANIITTEENAMSTRSILSRIRGGAKAMSAAIMIAPFAITVAVAADIPTDSLKFAPDVVKAPGYETPPAKYIVANGTNVYSDHSFYGTKVTGDLKRGEHVDALAKVKGWDWILVGKNGTGIGYVSISMLSPEDKYIP
jgi:hypothetical protein